MSETVDPWDDSWGSWLRPEECLGPTYTCQGIWYSSPIHVKGKVGDGYTEAATSHSRRPPTHQHRLDQANQQALQGHR